jgi:hypothetical protein
MICNCTKTRPVPSCILQLVAGTVSETSTSLIATFTNIATGRINYISCSSDGAGLVTIDLSGMKFLAGHAYDFTLSNEIGSAPLEITIGSVEYVCLSVVFEKFRNEDGTPVTVSSRTLEVA